MARELFEKIIPNSELRDKSQYDVSMMMVQILNAMMEEFRFKHNVKNDEFIDFILHKEEMDNGILMRVEFFTRKNEDRDKLLFG